MLAPQNNFCNSDLISIFFVVRLRLYKFPPEDIANPDDDTTPDLLIKENPLVSIYCSLLK